MVIQGRNDVRNFITISRWNKTWIRRESLFVGGKKSKNCCCFLNLIEDQISSTIVEKCLLKALAIAIGYVKVALLLMIALGDAWFKFFSEIMLFILFHVFSRSLIFSWKNVYFG